MSKANDTPAAARTASAAPSWSDVRRAAGAFGPEAAKQAPAAIARAKRAGFAPADVTGIYFGTQTRKAPLTLVLGDWDGAGECVLATATHVSRCRR